MIEIRRILCPVDFSEPSRRALQHAAVLARWYDAELTALHVISPVFMPPVMAPTPEIARAALPSDAGRRQLEEQLRSWLGEFEAPRARSVVEEGDPTRLILDRVESLLADLLVLGTHGHGGFDRLVLGSVTEKILRKASCPVLTVPPPAVTPRALPFKRLLCPTDFSDASVSALRYALSIAKESDAHLTILHVLEWPAHDDLLEVAPDLGAFRAYREDQARRRLEALVSEEERTFCEPVPMLEHGRPWERVLAVANAEQTDLIVIGLHGRNVVDLTLLGSTTNQVIRRAPCPVLTLRQ